MPTIITNSNKVDRSIEVEMPECLTVPSLEDMVTILGADIVMTKIKAQLTVDFRSKIRTLLESKTDDDFNHTDEAIKEMDFDDWKPEGRTRKTPEEKAAELLGKLSLEQIAAAMALAGK